ncbi:DUF992 domain-containing protein (plasmid) [Rhizobium sp. WYJ-E13]|nr:DUF992 domain-containing protein [Rhizobium sp. WYJ-E13]
MALCSTTLLLAAFATTDVAKAEKAQVGTLDCNVSVGIGAIVGSKQEVDCVFKPSASGPDAHYTGTITDFGLDIGRIEQGRMIWLVYNLTAEDVNRLDGTYRGVAADATIGLGVGAKVLMGGARDNLSLQPISVQGQEGVNLAVGVAALTLRSNP